MGGRKDPDHEAFGLRGPDVPCVALDSEPGDVIVFTESTFHSSFGSNTGRLQIYTEYLANPTTADQVADVREGHERFKWSFHPAESYINSERPRIRRMVSRLVELGFEPLKV
jgi:ectoine hydroxylase-related dioxygenase (phytanoyl-CoA dioxygenase family)